MPANEDARALVTAELTKRGFSTEEAAEGRRTILLSRLTPDASALRLFIKAKVSHGNWHTNIGEGDRQPDAQAFWIFVNLNAYAATPNYWVVPDAWMRSDIVLTHQAYLDANGGHRVKNDESNHHSISESRLSEWEGRWELLGLEDG